MPTFNASPYVGAAVKSILWQTLTEFELIVVDDASSDGTLEILSTIADARFRLVRNTQNLGVAASLNRGLELARGKYVARMDADDISDKERLARQFDFLESNPDIDVLGTQMWLLGPDGQSRPRLPPYPTTPGLVRWRMLLFNCLGHPTVMARRGFFEDTGGYDPEFVAAEDYELWLRASPSHNMANLPDRLLHHRIHPTSTYTTNESISQTSSTRAVARILSTVIGSVSEPACRAIQTPTVVRQLDRTGAIAAEATQLLDQMVAWSDSWPMTSAERAAVRADSRSVSAALFVAAMRTGLVPALSVRRVSQSFSWRAVTKRCWEVARRR